MKNFGITLSLFVALLLNNISLHAQDLYLIIGQSNAAGRSSNIDKSDLDKSNWQIKILDDNNSFVQAKQPLNQYSTIRKDLDMQGVNFGLEFAKSMLEWNNNRVRLVVNARGGTNIQSWAKGGEYYEEAVQRIETAKIKCDCELRGVLWHQGESNSTTSNGIGYTPSNYFELLETLVSDFRNDFGNSSLPFIVGEIRDANKNDSFNDKLNDFSDSDDNIYVASSEYLITPDGTHFSANSTRTLGTRYALKMKIALAAKESTNKSTDLTGKGTSEEAFVFFPNPSSDIIEIVDYQEGDIISIYTSSGVKLIDEKSKIIDVSSLDKGIYILNVGNSKKAKLVIE